MDDRRFDSLARTLGAAKTRRGVLASLGALAAGLIGSGAASAQQAFCPAGTDPCPGGGCVDKKRDPLNCGRCGRECPEGAECRKGKCVCPRGEVVIGDQCVCPNDCCSDEDCGFGGRCIGGTCDNITITITEN